MYMYMIRRPDVWHGCSRDRIHDTGSETETLYIQYRDDTKVFHVSLETETLKAETFKTEILDRYSPTDDQLLLLQIGPQFMF